MLILQTLLRNNMMSRQQIANKTKLTPATITNIVGELIEEGLLIEIGDLPDQKPRAGRKSVAVDFNPNTIYVIGLHIRTDRIELAIVNLKGQVIADNTVKFPENTDIQGFLDLVSKLIKEIIDQNPTINIMAIGIGSVGLINYKDGIILNIHHLGWENLDISTFISEKFKLPVYVDNNARAMTLAERMYGNNKKLENFLFVFIGHGIGAGLVINDDVFRGGVTGAGELGHMSLVPNGEPCWCGNKGCLERYASESFILKELKLSSINEFIQLINNKDPNAFHLLETVGKRISIVLTSFINMFHVDKIIVGGNLVQKNNELIQELEKINQYSFLARKEEVQIEVSILGEYIGVVGAASLALYNHVFQ
nr:ROK family protein [Aquibacillus albus]